MINKDFNSIEIPRRVTRFANFVMIKSSIKRGGSIYKHCYA